MATATTMVAIMVIAGAARLALLGAAAAWKRRVQRRLEARLHRFCGVYLSPGSAIPPARSVDLDLFLRRAA